MSEYLIVRTLSSLHSMMVTVVCLYVLMCEDQLSDDPIWLVSPLCMWCILHLFIYFLFIYFTFVDLFIYLFIIENRTLSTTNYVYNISTKRNKVHWASVKCAVSNVQYRTYVRSFAS